MAARTGSWAGSPSIWWSALWVGLALVAAGCGAGSAGSPPAVTTDATTTVASTVPSGLPTMGPGRATLSGTVVGPGGPVAGATVLVERIVDGTPAQARLTSGPGGGWRLDRVLGGGYRVRAWLAPGLAQTSPTAFFLADGADRVVDLELTSFSRPVVQSAIAPDPPLTDQDSQVVVQINARQVQSDGTVTTAPAEGLSLQLVGEGGWLISSANPAVTDSQGQATWTATCTSAGVQALAVDVGSPASGPTSSSTAGSSSTFAGDGSMVSLDVPDCELGPPSTTSTTPTTTTTSTTSTTIPGPTSSLTAGAGGYP